MKEVCRKFEHIWDQFEGFFIVYEYIICVSHFVYVQECIVFPH